MLRAFTILAVVAALSLGASFSTQAAGWQLQLHGLLPARFVKAFDVTTTAAGDVIAVGRVTKLEKFDEDFTVVRFDGSDGSEQWRRAISADSNDAARAVAVDPEGAVIAAGRLGGLALVKLDGATGADVWTTVVDQGKSGWVNSIAVDASGDVAAVGGLVDDVSKTDFAVVKVAGDTGAELWRQVVAGSETDPQADRRDEAKSVLVDSAGDVVASGWLRETDSGVTFTVIKFDGTTGSEIWRAQPSPSGRARAIAADANGDVFAVGLMNPGSGKSDFAVVKLDGSSGGELWRRELTGEALSFNDGLAVAVDSTGDVVAAGTFNNNDSRNDFSVVKLAGGNGAELWRSELRSAWIQGDAANALAIDADDNVVAVGRVSRRRRAPAHGFTVVKLDGSSGSRMWLRELDATSQGLSVFDEAFAVAVDAAGDVAAAGVLDEELSGPNFTVVKLGGADGLTAGACQQQPRTDCVTTARKSVLKIVDLTRAGPDPDRKDSLAWTWVGGPSVSFESMGQMMGAGDLRLCIYDERSGAASLAASLVIPGGGTCKRRACWKREGSPGDPRGYKYKDSEQDNSGVRNILIRAANLSNTKISLRGGGPGLSLGEPFSAAAYFDQDPSVTVQLVTTPGLCWEVAYSLADTRKNTGEQFKARCKSCP